MKVFITTITQLDFCNLENRCPESSKETGITLGITKEESIKKANQLVVSTMDDKEYKGYDGNTYPKFYFSTSEGVL